jgi:hypothetical protein
MEPIDVLPSQLLMPYVAARLADATEDSTRAHFLQAGVMDERQGRARRRVRRLLLLWPEACLSRRGPSDVYTSPR